MDSFSTINESRVGIVVTGPEGDEMEFAMNFEFKASNNKAEYEALIRGIKITLELGAQRVKIFFDFRLVSQQT